MKKSLIKIRRRFWLRILTFREKLRFFSLRWLRDQIRNNLDVIGLKRRSR